NTLWKVMKASYEVLNRTNPNLTEHCWLCFDIKPPFYEAIGVLNKGRRVNGTNSPQCLWKAKKEQSQGITLTQVKGKGRCMG
ncbi:ENV1 protein, partial [Pomatostomus ruficeps]|nr:ENV1 protein [Pomatostomus ruficeps]